MRPDEAIIVVIQDYVSEPEWEITPWEVQEILLQGTRHCRERNFIPGNFVLPEQDNFEAFAARAKIEALQLRAEKQMHLVDVNNVEK